MPRYIRTHIHPPTQKINFTCKLPFLYHTCSQCSICHNSSGGPAPKARESRRQRHRGGRGCREGVPSPREEGPREGAYDFFLSFQKVHSGAFLYTNSKVFFAIKCRKVRYHGILGDWQWYRYKTSSFHESRKLIPVQSVSSKTRRFYSYSRHVLSA